LAAIEVTSVVAGAVLGVSLAVAGFNGEALVGAGLGLVGTGGLLSFAAAPVTAFKTDRRVVLEMLGFATPVALSSLVYLGFRNVDYAILGARSSATQLGYYWRAFQFGVEYQSKISLVMILVSFPVYSRASSMDELRSIRTRIVRGHASVLVPLLAFFIAVAPVLVPWLFGPAWEPSVRPAQILAVAGMADAIVTGVGPLMIAIGRPGALLRWNVIVLAGYALMVFLLAPHGLDAVAIGVALFGVAIVIGSQAALMRPYAGLSYRQLWADTRAGIVVGVGVLLAATAVREVLGRFDLPAVITLIVLGSSAVVVYGMLLRMLFPAEWSDLRALAGRIGRGRRVADDAPDDAESLSGT
jgi:lipopolysaccharide exporter